MPLLTQDQPLIQAFMTPTTSNRSRSLASGQAQGDSTSLTELIEFTNGPA